MKADEREKRRAQVQQVTALREKLRVLLCQPLFPHALPANGATTGCPGNGSSAPAAQPQQSSKVLRKKMTLLGMIGGSQDAQQAGGREGTPEDRCRAQTRWLDGSNGRDFGGDWEGIVRTGASCDANSLQIRSKVETAKLTAASARPTVEKHGGTGKDDKDKGTVALAKWSPNPDTPDAERWGGRWGKPCGHNEVLVTRCGG